MQPSIPIPTDNIYKFSCLFGLVLIVSAIFSFVSSYSSALDRKIKYSEVLIPLEAKSQRSKTEDELLTMNKRLIEVTKQNEVFAGYAIALVFSAGVLLSVFGGLRWHNVIQKRDDTMAQLQIRKLEAEVAKLGRENHSAVPAVSQAG